MTRRVGSKREYQWLIRRNGCVSPPITGEFELKKYLTGVLHQAGYEVFALGDLEPDPRGRS